jgi:hypothetical protein
MSCAAIEPLVSAPWLLRALAQGLCGVLSLGCSALLNREHDQCRTSDDCQHFGAGTLCTTNGTCRQATTRGAPPTPGLCEIDADCGSKGICRDSTCAVLERPGCSTLVADTFDPSAERLPILVLLPNSALTTKQIRSAMQMAVNEWSQARSTEPSLPEPLVVECNAGDLDALDVTHEAGIRLVIAATRAVELEPIIQAAGDSAVVFAPFAEAPGLPNLDVPLGTAVVSCKPNRAASVEALLAAVSSLRAVLDSAGRLSPDRETVIAFSSDEVRYGYDVLFESREMERRAIEVVTYEATHSGDGLVSSLERASIAPGLIVAVSGEADWSPNLAAAERAFGGLEPPPFYLLTERQDGVRDLAIHDQPGELLVQQGLANPLRQRLLLWDYRLGRESIDVHEQFAVKLGLAPKVLSPYLDNVHDCFYVAAYAALAAQLYFALSLKQLSPQSVLVGLNALQHGWRLPIGAGELGKGLEALAASRGRSETLDLVGGSGDLDFVELPTPGSAYFSAPQPASGEFYCADADEKNYCSTGVTVSPSGELSGVNACRCFTLQ